MPPTSPAPNLLIGLGHPDRGDDALGLHVTALLRALAPEGWRALDWPSDPLGLMEIWGGVDLVVVCDATQGGGPPGTVRTVDATHTPLPADFQPVSGHAFGLAAAVETARALDRLPPRLMVVGVEGAAFGLGESLSPAVAAALPRALETALATACKAPESQESRNRQPNP